MTSQIRVDEITNRSGLGTVTIYDNGFEFTGVTTFTENVDIEGNLTIGGVLTYEDTTNIDSVGVITARGGIRVTGDSIHVESSEDRLLYLKSTDANAYLTFEDTDSSSAFANRVGTVSDGLYFSTGGGGERLRINANGVFDFKDNSFTNVGSIALDYIKGDADDNTNITFAGNDVITFKAGSTSPALTVNTTQVKVEDNQRFVAGTGNDLQIYHDGTINRIRFDVNTVFEKNDSEDIATFLPDGAVTLFHNGTARLETTTAGVAIHEDTDKVVRFTGLIGEIGNVTGFQASNTAGNSLTDFGMRANTLRFATGSSERLRIDSYGKIGINTNAPTARLDINHPHTEQGLVVRSRYGNIATAMVKFDGDPDSNGGDGNVVHIHGGSSRTDSEILHIDSTGVGDIFDIRGDGLTRVYKQLQLEHSSNVAKIIFNEYGANDPKAQIEMDQINGSAGQLIFRTQQSGTLSQRLRISSGGTLYYNGESQTVAGGGGSAHKVLVTSAYEEWHFTWSGTSSRTATFTCPSYFHAEVIYTSHQTNGGTDIHRYIRGKWANNYTHHTWVQHEDVGNTWALTSFSINVTHNGGNQQNGKLTISETYNSGSLSTRAVIMRIYYGASGLGWNIA